MFLNKQIIRYLSKQKCFKTARDIHQDLNLSNDYYATFDIKLKSLAAKHKILMVPLRDTYRYSKPLKTKSGRILSGLVDTYDYLMLSSELEDN